VENLIKKLKSLWKMYGAQSLFYIILRRILLEQSKLSLKFDVPYHLRRLIYGYAIVPVNGLQMYVDLKNDKGISKDLFIFKKREHLSTDFLSSQHILNEGDVVIDIGANIGYYALLESRIVGSSGVVYALEPVSNNYRLLEKNIKLNNITNVVPFRFAAGKETGDNEIYVGAKGNLSSFIYRTNQQFTKKEKVHIVSIDDFLTERKIHPTLIRMDVEGYEVEIIKGMQQTLQQRPKLLVEVHSNLVKAEQLEQMFKTIYDNGYRGAVVIKERNQLWMKRNGEIKPSLQHLTRLISGDTYALGMGNIEYVPIEELMRTLWSSGSAFHALLS
jgi:FkbM family methyltransferase